MGKGVSGGYAPLGAVAARQHVRDGLRGAGRGVRAHLHVRRPSGRRRPPGSPSSRSGSGSGSPSGPRGSRPRSRAALDRLREHPFVGDVRVTGLMAGIEFVADRETKEPFEPSMKFGTRVREAGLRNGIVTYPGSGMADGARGDIISPLPAADRRPRRTSPRSRSASRRRSSRSSGTSGLTALAPHAPSAAEPPRRPTCAGCTLRRSRGAPADPEAADRPVPSSARAPSAPIGGGGPRGPAGSPSRGAPFVTTCIGCMSAAPGPQAAQPPASPVAVTARRPRS